MQIRSLIFSALLLIPELSLPQNIKVLVYEGRATGITGDISITQDNTGEFTLKKNGKIYNSRDGICYHTAEFPVKINSGIYTGTLLFSAQANVFRIINILDFEDYVSGVTACEISHTWPEEAIKAQALVARTYSWLKYQQNLKNQYHIKADDTDQVFRGSANLPGNIINFTRATAGKIICCRGKPVEAFFHSCCGGVTEEPENVWGGKKEQYPYLKKKTCSYCANSPVFAWKTAIALTELNAKFSSLSAELGGITGIRPLERSSSGRYAKILVLGKKGSREMQANFFRMSLGAKNLPSLFFSASSRGKTIVFSGKGYGHGIGLCQWGAHELAKRGWNYTGIIRFYFSGITIESVPKP
ncbi:MAG TPA: hypothetical protein DC049_01685 [Spirochaetia bacterium]|nr:hypothetical protein [Spirochaetia bacterium]